MSYKVKKPQTRHFAADSKSITEVIFLPNHPNGANEKKVKSPARLFSDFPHLTRKLNNLFALLTVRLSVPRCGRRLPKKRRQILLFLFSSFRSVRPQVSNDSMKFRPHTNSGQKNCYNMFCNDILGQIELLSPYLKLVSQCTSSGCRY